MFDLVKPKPQVPAIATRVDASTDCSKQVAVRPVEVLPAGRAATPEFRFRLQGEEAELRAAASVRARLRDVALFRAADAVRCSRLELACKGEAIRLNAIQETVAGLADSFAARIDDLECRLRDRVPPEILEALKQRMFEEMTASVNRVSRYGERASEGSL